MNLKLKDFVVSALPLDPLHQRIMTSLVPFSLHVVMNGMLVRFCICWVRYRYAHRNKKDARFSEINLESSFPQRAICSETDLSKLLNDI